MKILIVRLSALGDIVHALPVLAAIKRAKPDAQVDWLVEENYASILSIASGLRRRIIVRATRSFAAADAISFGGVRGYHAAAKYLWNQDYDVALDLQGLIKSAIWARISFADRVIGFDEPNLREPQAAFLYSQTVTPVERLSGGQVVRSSGQHIIHKNLSILSALNIAPGEIEIPLVPHASADTAAAIDTAGGSRGFIVLNPGAAWPNKRWPPERFGALAAALFDRTAMRTLVTWGPSERELANAVVSASNGAANLAPATSVSDLAVLMREAALVVSGDTGPLHIAAAMGTPLVGLYGPTWPQRNGPWDPEDVVISRANACVCHHKRQCQRGAPCINEITVDEVVTTSVARLRQRSGAAGSL
ncbi:MAG TPA: lipopolysaccharide heptosyltransferase I [Vicinamibacterales bacterium]|nr:lipopolysaccharide heptosyltransferase I [Vicinamibacterales bacterium]